MRGEARRLRFIVLFPDGDALYAEGMSFAQFFRNLLEDLLVHGYLLPEIVMGRGSTYQKSTGGLLRTNRRDLR